MDWDLLESIGGLLDIIGTVCLILLFIILCRNVEEIRDSINEQNKILQEKR